MWIKILLVSKIFKFFVKIIFIFVREIANFEEGTENEISKYYRDEESFRRVFYTKLRTQDLSAHKVYTINLLFKKHNRDIIAKKLKYIINLIESVRPIISDYLFMTCSRF